MAISLKILSKAEDKLTPVERTHSHKPIFITATNMLPVIELPNWALEATSPENLTKMAGRAVSGNVIFPHEIDEEEETLASEVPVVLIRHPKMVIEQADEVVSQAGKATLLLRYPLSVSVGIEILAPSGGGITRGQILHAIHDGYAEIYRQENAAAPASAPDDRGMFLNREETAGPFGIWGHDINDLIVETISIFTIEDEVWIRPNIGS